MAGYDCNTGVPVYLAPGASLPPLGVLVSIPDDGQTCHLKNTATITAPLGPNLNSVASNDTSSATVDVPSPNCLPVLKDDNACPILQRMPDGGCCPDGQNWNGRSCGNQPPPSCPPNTTGTYPNCTTITNNPTPKPKPKPRPKPTPKVCPDGYTGTYPDCKLILTPKCPDNTIGKYPNCRPIVVKECPKGTSGTYPNCILVEKPRCLYGGIYPNCNPKPRDTTPNIQGGGTLKPLNQAPKCPAGTSGIFPLCIPNQPQIK